MKWDYTETLTKKELIDILRGMADSLESKGELEAWIGNTKIVVDVAPQFILETIFNEDKQKGETHFHFHLSWVHEPEEKIPTPPEKTVVSQFVEVKPDEEKPLVTHEEFQIDTAPATPSSASAPPTPTEIMSAKPSPPAPEPPTPTQGMITEDIPLPPSSEETQKDWRDNFDKEMAEFGIPIETKATPEATVQAKAESVTEPSVSASPSMQKEATIAVPEATPSIASFEMYSVYESAFGWSIQNEWSEVNPSSPEVIYSKTPSREEIQMVPDTTIKPEESKKELKDLETKPPEVLEQELFGDLDDEEDHLVRPSDFLKRGRKKQ